MFPHPCPGSLLRTSAGDGRALAVLALLAGLATACGSGSSGGGADPGGGGSEDNPAPEVELIFPPPLAETDATWIFVTGTARDPDGVVEVRVNGQPAASSDGFGTWRVGLRLAPGTNELVVSATDARGAQAPAAARARVEAQAVLVSPLGLAVDAALDRALVTDIDLGAVVAVDLERGTRTALSGPTAGQGPAFRTPVDITLDGARALVSDPGLQAVLAVDLATGDRRTVTSSLAGGGPRPLAPAGIAALDPGRAVLADGRRLLAIDEASGERVVLSDETVGAGPAFLYAQDVELDAGRALVLDISGGLMAVDPASGDRTWLSGPGLGLGPELTVGQALALDGGRALVTGFVHDGAFSGALVAIDLASGDRRVLSAPDVGAGPDLTGGAGLALDARRGRALVMDVSLRNLLAVDLATGARSVLSSVSLGRGPALFNPVELALDGGFAYVIDQNLPGLVRVELASGERTIVAGASVGAGPALQGPRWLALDPARGRVLVWDESAGVLFAVDLASGDRSVLADAFTGAGPALLGCAGLTLDGERALLLGSFDVDGAFQSGLLAVDLASGDRTVLSSPDVGAGQALDFSSGLARDGERVLTTMYLELGGVFELAVIAIDLASGDRSLLTSDSLGSGAALLIVHGMTAGNGQLYVTSLDDIDSQPALLAIDLATGARRIVSGPARGGGPRLLGPAGIALDGERTLVIDNTLGALVAIDLVYGQRALVSR